MLMNLHPMSTVLSFEGAQSETLHSRLVKSYYNPALFALIPSKHFHISVFGQQPLYQFGLYSNITVMDNCYNT